MHAIDLSDIRRHIGARIVEEDVATRAPLEAIVATFNRDEAAPAAGEDIPAGWHVGYFPVRTPTALLGVDGLPGGTDLLPPMPLPRKMYAGNRISFQAPLRVGDPLRRETELSNVQLRNGSTGPLIVATQTRRISTPRGVAIVEEYDSVFRAAVAPGAANPAPKAEAPPAGMPWTRVLDVGVAMLFRFSALTGNPHRIHYDRPYAMEAEGYPGLVVHGPFLQTCLLDFMRDCMPGKSIRSFSLRARAPVFDVAPVRLVAGPAPDGAGCRASALTAEGSVAMDAVAGF
ncbi:MAG: MaoC family dehydratase N-terminal domain-containing protein [Hyphomicrobiaceae bacterium]|nr:MaoC family dehydratase N-terminal domain-containing protein [Hyphomicrobiaceae bacterium]